jgi:prevent-host-death family protein
MVEELTKGARMAKPSRIIPVSDLRHDAAAVVRRVQKSRKPTIVTRRGRASIVMLSVDLYESAEEERRILRALARGDREIRTGQGASLRTVLRDADALLETD